MTQGEFWQGEAQREGEGRTGGDLQADFYAELDQEWEEEHKRFLEHDNVVEIVNRALVENEQCVRDEAVLAAGQAAFRLALESNPDHPRPRFDMENLAPKVALAEILHVTKVIDFYSTDFRDGMRSSESSFIAYVECSNGKERRVSYSMWGDSGSYWEPPDGGVECDWVEEGKP
jgi:hypothetical protein